MYKYKYALIDANYILRRNTEAICKGSSELISASKIVDSFHTSIRKLKRDVGFDIPLLLFDKSPYKKSEHLPEYKGDRVYITEDYVKELLKNNPNMNVTELMDLYREANKNKQSMIAKYTLVKYPTDNGISIIKRGYEADDLAYLIGLKLKSKDYKSVLLSSDSDWITFINDNVDYMTLKLNPKSNIQDQWKVTSEEFKIPIYDLGILAELYYYSHNNIEVYKNKYPEVSYKDFCMSMFNSIDNIPDYSTYKGYYDGMNMNKWVDDIEVNLE